MNHPEPTNKWELDANYYRLGYLLLATEINRDEQNSRGSQASTSAAIEKLEDTRIPNALALSKQVDSVLAYFDERQKGSRFGLRRALSPGELRLQRFLAETIEPGVRLLAMREQGKLATLPTIPALLVEDVQDIRPGRSPVAPRRMLISWTRFRRSLREVHIKWSYRAFYSLACAYAVRNEPPQVQDLELAARALDEAFRRAHGQNRISLLEWAKADPTLARLRMVKGRHTLDQVLDKYANETTKPAEESDGAQEPSLPTAVGRKSRRAGTKRRTAKREGSGTRAAEALSFVQGQPGITIPELAAKMGIKQNYLYRVLPGLEQEGKVTKEGTGWHPKGQPAP